MEDVASLSQATKRYGKVVALDAVSIGFGPGVTAVLGPNGAGKSTLVEVTAGLRRLSEGTVTVLGGDPTDRSVRSRLGLTPQQTALPWRLTVGETLGLVAAHHPRASHAYRTRLAEQLDLGPIWDKRNGTLSGGQRRRVALATAMIGEPELVFLDEPTTGMDADNRNRLWAAITDLAGTGRAIVLTTHDMVEAETLANQVVVIAEGRLVLTGSVDSVCAEVGLHLVEMTLPGGIAEGILPDEDIVEVVGDRLRVLSPHPDTTVRALVRHDVPFTGIRVSRVGLEEAIRAVTAQRPQSPVERNS